MESSVTLSMRSNGPMNCNLNDLVINLNCYPRICLVYPSYTPFHHNERRSFSETIVSDLTKQIFMASSQMLKLYDVQNKIAVSLFYRGLISPYEVR